MKDVFESQYGRPDDLPRVASDPDLVMELDDSGYIVDILPSTGGLEVVYVVAVLMILATVFLAGYVLYVRD